MPGQKIQHLQKDPAVGSYRVVDAAGDGEAHGEENLWYPARLKQRNLDSASAHLDIPVYTNML